MCHIQSSLKLPIFDMLPEVHPESDLFIMLPVPLWIELWYMPIPTGNVSRMLISRFDCISYVASSCSLWCHLHDEVTMSVTDFHVDQKPFVYRVDAHPSSKNLCPSLIVVYSSQWQVTTRCRCGLSTIYKSVLVQLFNNAFIHERFDFTLDL